MQLIIILISYFIRSVIRAQCPSARLDKYLANVAEIASVFAGSARHWKDTRTACVNVSSHRLLQQYRELHLQQQTAQLSLSDSVTDSASGSLPDSLIASIESSIAVKRDFEKLEFKQVMAMAGSNAAADNLLDGLAGNVKVHHLVVCQSMSVSHVFSVNVCQTKSVSHAMQQRTIFSTAAAARHGCKPQDQPL